MTGTQSNTGVTKVMVPVLAESVIVSEENRHEQTRSRENKHVIAHGGKCYEETIKDMMSLHTGEPEQNNT